ncbi:hypothetical protein FACS1894130_12530 [Spirochaetia bacterium]|nr:hypothetical protein FACS1894130_12530 [Spirochaetia bacterium]
MQKETDQLIAEILDEAKSNYEVVHFFESLDDPVNDPLIIKDREKAVWACRYITLILRRVMGVKEGSILDRLLSRLTEYIKTGYKEQ